MSASNEHTHHCIKCGKDFQCWCSNENEMSDQRMCNDCGTSYRRLRDHHGTYKNFKSLQRPNSWRR